MSGSAPGLRPGAGGRRPAFSSISTLTDAPPGEGRDEAVHLGRACSSRSPRRGTVAGRRRPARQRDPAEDPRAASAVEQRRRASGASTTNSLKVGPAKRDPEARDLRDPGLQVLGLRVALARRPRGGPSCRAATGGCSRRAPSAPGSCRCSRSPSRDGCAARASRASAERAPPVGVLRLARRGAPESGAGAPCGGHEPEEGPAEVHRDAERLRLAARDVGPACSRGREERRATPPRRRPRPRARRPACAARGPDVPVLDDAEEVGRLHRDGEGRRVHGRRQAPARRSRRPRRAGPRRSRARGSRSRCERSRGTPGGSPARRAPRASPALRQPLGHQQRLDERRRSLVERRVRHLEARQQADVRLELEDRLEGPLGDLRLVRRVGGQPLRAVEHLVRDRGHVVVVDAAAQEERRVAGIGVACRRCRRGTGGSRSPTADPEGREPAGRRPEPSRTGRRSRRRRPRPASRGARRRRSGGTSLVLLFRRARTARRRPRS